MLMDIRQFLPAIVLERDREKPWQEWLSGTVLFADVAGFTSMTESLAVLGDAGAERLTDLLNRYFARMIWRIHAHSGQVMKFGGDALLCFFPGHHTLAAAIACACRMQEDMIRHKAIRTPVRKFALQMKIGIAEGEVLLAGVGDPSVRSDFIFAGTPIDRATEAEHHAGAGDIILADPDGQRQAAGGRWEATSDDYFRLVDFPSDHLTDRVSAQNIASGRRSDNPPEPPRPSRRMTKAMLSSHHEAVRPYMIREIYEIVSTGYHQQARALIGIVPVFMRFAGFSYERSGLRLSRLHEFFVAVNTLIQHHGGRLNRISMGDKGSTFLILFGAPAALEEKEALACQFALDIMRTVRKDFPDVELGIGMGRGRVFAGIIGGSGRWEYTVMGDAVNLAARVMQSAKAAEILLPSALAQEIDAHYQVQEMGEHRFKGIHAPVSIYRLTGKARRTTDFLSRHVIWGREKEMTAVLENFSEDRRERPSVIMVEGAPGQGKTAFAAALIERASETGWQTVVCRGEASRSGEPHAPWIELLSALAFDGQIPSKAELIKSFKDDQAIQDLAMLFDPSGLGSAALRQDESGQKMQQWHHRLAGHILQYAAGQRTLLCFEDIHLFDSLSSDLLITLIRRLKDGNLCVLATTRPLPSDHPLGAMPFVQRVEAIPKPV